jgi:hypothetical protein
MRITISFTSAVLFVAAVTGAPFGCDDPCADLKDRCDECDGNDKPVCTRIVDAYDYDACDEALDSDLCMAPGGPSTGSGAAGAGGAAGSGGSAEGGGGSGDGGSGGGG